MNDASAASMTVHRKECLAGAKIGRLEIERPHASDVGGFRVTYIASSKVATHDGDEAPDRPAESFRIGEASLHALRICDITDNALKSAGIEIGEGMVVRTAEGSRDLGALGNERSDHRLANATRSSSYQH